MGSYLCLPVSLSCYPIQMCIDYDAIYTTEKLAIKCNYIVGAVDVVTMVLSNAELKAAANCEIRKDKKARMSSLYHLRQNTSSFVIQCLADREIQLLIYLHENASSKLAYRYNCAIIHAPHACSHLDAVDGNGWNENKNHPYDPKLKIGHILARQYSHCAPNNVANLATNNDGLRQQQNDQLEETIRILQEEKAKMKQIYLSRMRELNDAVGSFNENKVKLDRQQVNQLQQKIQTLNSSLQFQEATVRLLRDENSRLQVTLKNLQAESLSKKNVNVPDSQRMDQLDHQLKAMRLDLQHKNEQIYLLGEENSNLHVAFLEAQNQLTNNRIISGSSRTNDEHAPGCCVFM